jgi:hypothetical protein
MSPNLMAELTDMGGARFGETSCKENTWPNRGSGGAAYKKAPRPFVISGPAYPMMPSLNQVVRLLTDWEGLRRMAA